MNLNSVFNPNSIAIVGASSNSSKLGHQILKKVIANKKIDIYPVNPKSKSILGLRTYSSILDVGKPIDQVIIVIPARFVSEIINQCLKIKVKSVIVVTAGFSETGAKGKKLEDQIKKLINSSKLALVGPNCLGYANPKKRLDITFAKTPPSSGNIALISQSGAVGSFLFDWASNENLGFSKFISLGNRAGVTEADCLEYLKNDSQTKVIGLYLESFSDGKKFLTIARKVSKIKPILVLFGGVTKLGKKATQSHTAALSPETKIISTAIKQAGCIHTKSLEEFTDLLEIFSLEPPLIDNDLTIITNAGGPAILATDQVGQSDLDLVELKDILGDATTKDFKNTITKLLKVKKTDAFLVIASPQSQTDFLKIAQAIASKFKKIKKPIIVSFLGNQVTKSAEAYLQRKGIATIKFPQKAVKYFNALFHYYHDRSKKIPYPVRQSSRVRLSKLKLHHLHSNLKPGLPASPSQGGLSWRQIKKLAIAYKLPLVKTFTLTSKNIDPIIKHIGLPIVLKSDPSEAIHRTEKKGLFLNLKSKTMVSKARQNLSKQFFTILAQPQLTKGTEIFIGLNRQQDFPPLLTIGSGGIYTEVYQDVIHAFLPLNKKLLLQLIKQTKIGQIILGVRGQSPLAINQLINTILNASYLMTDFPQIQNIDINPVILSTSSANIVDIKITIN